MDPFAKVPGTMSRLPNPSPAAHCGSSGGLEVFESMKQAQETWASLKEGPKVTLNQDSFCGMCCSAVITQEHLPAQAPS